MSTDLHRNIHVSKNMRMMSMMSTMRMMTTLSLPLLFVKRGPYVRRDLVMRKVGLAARKAAVCCTFAYVGEIEACLRHAYVT